MTPKNHLFKDNKVNSVSTYSAWITYIPMLTIYNNCYIQFINGGN